MCDTHAGNSHLPKNIAALDVFKRGSMTDSSRKGIKRELRHSLPFPYLKASGSGYQNIPFK